LFPSFWHFNAVFLAIVFGAAPEELSFPGWPWHASLVADILIGVFFEYADRVARDFAMVYEERVATTVAEEFCFVSCGCASALLKLIDLILQGCILSFESFDVLRFFRFPRRWSFDGRRWWQRALNLESALFVSCLFR
jgi:hypothetical protein